TSKFHIALTIDTRKNIMTCGLYIHGSVADFAYKALLQQKDEIENEYDCQLEWMELPDSEASRIMVVKDCDVKNNEMWGEYCRWVKENAENFHKVFSRRVKSL
ncbi:MAG: DUF4268 domain-containing protein, partial [bacterium]